MRQIETGQVLCSTWGYDQTNATFAKVLKVSGDWATVHKLKSRSEWQGTTMTGKAIPLDVFDLTERPIRRKIRRDPQYDESIKLESWGMWASPWDGQPVNVSCYA